MNAWQILFSLTYNNKHWSPFHAHFLLKEKYKGIMDGVKPSFKKNGVL
jgi:hypothetical protein